MLRPKRNEVVHRGSIIPLNIRAKELSSLREPNCVETILEFCDVCNLFSDKVDLFVHVSILRYAGEWIAGVCEPVYNVRSRLCGLVLGPPRCTPNE